MDCTTHFLGVTWNHHAWRRRVTSTETIPTSVTDMWGRDVAVEHVRCHTEEVCLRCGAVRDTGYCLCDPAQGDACAVRLRHLGTGPAETLATGLKSALDQLDER